MCQLAGTAHGLSCPITVVIRQPLACRLPFTRMETIVLAGIAYHYSQLGRRLSVKALCPSLKRKGRDLATRRASIAADDAREPTGSIQSHGMVA